MPLAPVNVNAVTIVDALTLLVQLDTSCRVEPGLYDGANFVISERFGTGQNLYVKSVVLGTISQAGGGGVDTVDSMTLTLRDYVIMKGHYILNIMGLHAYDGAELTCVGFNFVDTTAFTLPGPPQPTATPIIQTLRKYLFKWIDSSAGSVLGELLYALGMTIHKFGGTDAATQGLQAAKDGLVLRSGSGTDLDVIASNYGIRRPSLQNMLSDASLVSYIKQMAWEPKAIRERIHRLVEIAIGPQNPGAETALFGPRTVHFLKPLGWASTMKCHAWWFDGTNWWATAWPGVDMTAEAGGWFRYTFVAGAGIFSAANLVDLVFDDAAGNQTGTLATDLRYEWWSTNGVTWLNRPGGWEIYEPRSRTIVIALGNDGLPLGNGFSSYLNVPIKADAVTHVGPSGAMVVTQTPGTRPQRACSVVVGFWVARPYGGWWVTIGALSAGGSFSDLPYDLGGVDPLLAGTKINFNLNTGAMTGNHLTGTTVWLMSGLDDAGNPLNPPASGYLDVGGDIVAYSSWAYSPGPGPSDTIEFTTDALPHDKLDGAAVFVFAVPADEYTFSLENAQPYDCYLVSSSKETPGQTGGTGPLHTGCFISSRGRIKEFDEIMDLAKAAGVTVEVVRKGE